MPFDFAFRQAALEEQRRRPLQPPERMRRAWKGSPTGWDREHYEQGSLGKRRSLQAPVIRLLVVSEVGGAAGGDLGLAESAKCGSELVAAREGAGGPEAVLQRLGARDLAIDVTRLVLL